MTPAQSTISTSRTRTKRQVSRLSKTSEPLSTFGAPVVGLLDPFQEEDSQRVVASALTANYAERPPWWSLSPNSTDDIYGSGMHLAYIKEDAPQAGTLPIKIEQSMGGPACVVAVDSRVIFVPQVGISHADREVGNKHYGSRWESDFPGHSLPVAKGSSVEENPTDVYIQAYVSSRLKNAFDGAAEEVFEDGMDSTFAQEIQSILRFGDIAVNEVEALMDYERMGPEIVRETLLQIGTVDDRQSHNSRLSLLLRKLESSEPRTRDAASLGIADLDDPYAIEAIQRAIAQENSSLLVNDLRLVLYQLQATRLGKLS